MTDGAYVAELQAVGVAAGLDAVGVAPAEVFHTTRRDLEVRRAEGRHGGMEFTYRNPARSTDPAVTLPEVRALVVAARSYHRPPGPAAGDPASGPQATVARYARRDHYADLRAGLETMAERLRGDGWVAVVLADDNALVDREAAYLAGLGWYGKNSNLLLPGRGSWFVLGSVLTDAALPPNREPVADGCGPCRRCLDGCPTGAIVAPGVVDARRCLAWLVQATGGFPRQYRAALGDRLYGCDDCQEVCPPNRRSAATGPDDGPEAEVDLCALLAASDDELMDRHGRWYIPRRDPDYLRRNALVVLGNSGAGDQPEVGAALGRYLGHPSPMLRSHAVWAARRLGRDDLLGGLAGDPDPAVRHEVEAAG